MIKLIHGDCLEKMNDIENGSVDMVLADPPYGTTKCKWDTVIPFEPMWNHLKRIIKPNGVIVLMAQTPFDKILGASNLSMLRHEWIWEKTAATGFLNAKKMPLKAHENILIFSENAQNHYNMLVFYKNLPGYYPQITDGHENKTSSRGNVNSECYGKAIKTVSYNSTKRYPRSVLKFPSDKQKLKLHPTQKPVALMEYFIKTYTLEGDTVVDFTMGSGTTGVPCKKLNRHFIGIEKEKVTFNIAKDRIERTQIQQSLFP